MKTFKNFLKEEYVELQERLITFGGMAYPKYGTIVIMAGGAGSGKGFIKDNLIGAEGYSFDVDALKILASKAPMIIDKIKKEMGVDLTSVVAGMKNPENTSKLHAIIGQYMKLDDRRLKALYTSIFTAAPDRKPNIIFDVTLSNIERLESITKQAKALGYDPKRIHIVWVVNDITVAQKQNAGRTRVVPEDILLGTHQGAARTMKQVMDTCASFKTHMDGDIVIAFNQVNVDSELVKGGSREKGVGSVFSKKDSSKAGFVKKADYFYIKRAGRGIDFTDGAKFGSQVGLSNRKIGKAARKSKALGVHIAPDLRQSPVSGPNRGYTINGKIDAYTPK